MKITFERSARLADIPFDQQCVVIADSRLPDALRGALPDPILVDGGESLKSLARVGELAERVLARRATRPLTLVAVGGGSVGDAVGFLASILWRGVTLWHVPTTLLAIVDSAHGGKTAVNLGAHKNQLGTWHPSDRTFIVDEVLETMPLEVRREGLSEIVKALMLSGEAHAFSPATIERLASAPFREIRDVLVPLVERAIWIKMDVVARDPRETHGVRTLLNLGHTIGHALELSTFLPHGAAVAWGLAAMLEVSRRFGLSDDARRALHARIAPLLVPLPAGFDVAHVRDAMQRDKKRLEGSLRSVVLEGEGKPLLTDAVLPAHWIESLEHVQRRHERTPVRAVLKDARRVTIRAAAGKSALNRALILAALRYGRTTIIGRSEADDVLHLVRALRLLDIPLHDTPTGWIIDHSKREEFISRDDERIVHCGEGGTTFRFLLALACMNTKETVLLAAPQLLARPHEPLLRSLRSAGATIEHVVLPAGEGYRVRGWDVMPQVFSVDVTQSSQFASAIALLAAGADTPFTIRLLGTPVSASYIDMTVAMLEQAGVECIRSESVIALNPTSRVDMPAELRISPDASSLAVWRLASYLEHPLRIDDPGEAAQPDNAIEALLDRIRDEQRAGVPITIDCAATPDLVPLLCVAALRSRLDVRLEGIAHLRGKESNRIDDLAASFAALGVELVTSPDAIVIPGGALMDLRVGRFHTHADHRMVMAGLMLSMLVGEIEIDHPWSVTKSYPGFWNDARMAGWSVLPVEAPHG